jgi:hypothetical protein
MIAEPIPEYAAVLDPDEYLTTEEDSKRLKRADLRKAIIKAVEQWNTGKAGHAA